MRGNNGHLPSRLMELRDQARILNERMQRTAIALALTEDLLADMWAQSDNDGRSIRRLDAQLEAKRARAAADEFRSFANRLAEINRLRELPGFDHPEPH